MEALAVELECLDITTRLSRVDEFEGAVELLVVDSYALRADDRDRFNAPVVAALDDLERDLDVTLVVDPSPGANSNAHRNASNVLAGPDFAVLDRTILGLVPRLISDNVSACLVTMGASDQGGIGREISRQLTLGLPSAHVQLVVGPWGSPAVPDGVEAVVGRRDGLASLLADADIVVCAG